MLPRASHDASLRWPVPSGTRDLRERNEDRLTARASKTGDRQTLEPPWLRASVFNRD